MEPKLLGQRLPMRDLARAKASVQAQFTGRAKLKAGQAIGEFTNPANYERIYILGPNTVNNSFFPLEVHAKPNIASIHYVQGTADFF